MVSVSYFSSRGLVHLCNVVFVAVFLFLPKMLSANSEIDGFLAKGDSLLNLDAYSEAREAYKQAFLLSEEISNSYLGRLSQYKKAFSYRVEGKKDSTRIILKNIRSNGAMKTAADTALHFLVNRELDYLDRRYLDPDYDYYEIMFYYYNQLPFVDERIRDNLTFFMASLDYMQDHTKMAVVKFEKLIKSQTVSDYLKEYSLFFIGGCYMVQNDFKKANTYFQELIANKSRYIPYYSLIRFVANNYKALHEYNKAILLYQEILQESTSDDMTNSDLLEVLSQLGSCYTELKSYDMAEATFKKLKTYVKLDQESANMLVYSYIAWTSLCLNQGEIKRAYSILDKADKVIDSYDIDLFLIIQYYKKLAQYYDHLNEYIEVQNTVETFISKYSKSYDIKKRSRVKWQYRILLLKSYDSMVKLWEKDNTRVGLLEKALEGYEQTLLITFSYFNNIMEEDSKYKYVLDLRSDYEKVFLTSYRLYQITKDKKYLGKIYNSLEKSKAYLFDGSLKYQKQTANNNFSQDFLDFKWDLKKSFDRINYELSAGSESLSEVQQLLLNKKLPLARARYDSILRVEERIIDKTKEERSFDFRELPKKLEADQVVLDYLLTEEGRLFVSLINFENTQLIEIKPKQSVKDLAIQFRQLILEQGAKSSLEGEDLADYKRIAYQLYDCLFGTLKPYINGKEILIIPDKELAGVPFDALIADTLGRNFSELNYMVKNYNISELYSINQLYESDVYIKSNFKVFGFAPDYSQYNQDSLALLPGAVEEVKSLDKNFRGAFYYSEKANKNNFFKAEHQYDIVHLALHTDVNYNNPDFSRLLFTDPEGSLPVFEIYGSEWDAKLLVLSGCNTGDGTIKWGEGMVSLARAFFFVGIKNIVATKWPVVDYSGSHLMENFYMDFKEKESVGQSLQEAKIKFLKGGDPLLHHPYYWASYYSVGHPVYFEENSSHKYIWIISGGILIFFSAIIMKLKKGNN